MKKPMKKIVINLLNEKYGINIQNLKETATFSSLATTQTVIFEALARLAPKGSVVRETLSELGKMLSTKNGVEVIDVNDILQEAFESCEYTLMEDNPLISSISFNSLLEEGEDISETLKEAANKLLLDKKKKKAKKEGGTKDVEPGDDQESSDKEEVKGKIADLEAHPANDRGEEDDSVEHAECGDEKVYEPGKKKSKKKIDAAYESVTEEEAPETAEEATEIVDPEEAPLTKEEYLDALKDLDNLLAGMNHDDDADYSDDDEE